MFLNRIILYSFIFKQPASFLCVLFLLLLVLINMLTDSQQLALLPSRNFKRMIIGVLWITQDGEFRPLMVQFKLTLVIYLSLMWTKPVLCLHASWIHITCLMLQNLRSWYFMVSAIRKPMKLIPSIHTETKYNPYWAEFLNPTVPLIAEMCWQKQEHKSVLV